MHTIYVIKEKGTSYYKVGFSNDAIQRLDTLQIANPRKLYIYKIFFNKDVSDEKALHQELKEYNVSGEWFEFENIEPAIKKMEEFLNAKAHTFEEYIKFDRDVNYRKEYFRKKTRAGYLLQTY